MDLLSKGTNTMRVLISAGWLGGAGGAERALYSILRALEKDRVDVVVRERLSGPYAEVGDHVRVHSLYDWRWRAAARGTGAKGALIQSILNPLRSQILPRFDVYMQFYAGPSLGRTIRARHRLFIPSGSEVSPRIADSFDAVALQAPDNTQFVPSGTRTILLPPPLYHLADSAQPPRSPLPETFFLTAFNPWGAVKGTDDLRRVADSAPHPIVWCHSQATLRHVIPEELARHPNIVHIEDATPQELRYLYENCSGYCSVSLTEGFGWSIADALRYAPSIYSRRIGVMTFPEACDQVPCEFSDTLDFSWSPQENATCQARALEWLSPDSFRTRLASL